MSKTKKKETNPLEKYKEVLQAEPYWVNQIQKAQEQLIATRGAIKVLEDLHGFDRKKVIDEINESNKKEDL